MIRLLLVDDQSLIRQGLASLLSLEEDFEVVGHAGHGAEAVSLVESLTPDLILMDIRMPVMDGVAATRTIREKHPSVRVLVLTTFDEDEYIVQAMQAGASGYLLKDAPTEELAAAIRSVHKGNTQLGPSILDKLMHRMSTQSSGKSKEEIRAMFTGRELEILEFLSQGKSNKEIAQACFITEGTVKNHITKILSLLNVRDRTQAALWAEKNL